MAIRKFTPKDILERCKSAPLLREFKLDVSGIDVEKRTVPLAFSSEEPVERWFGIEILDHGKDAADLSRLNDGGPLLFNHNMNDHLGVVEDAWIDKDRTGRSVVRFGRSARAEEKFQDVQDGILTKVSFSYFPREVVLEKTGKDVENTYRITQWQAYEISMVTLPADNTVGVGRSMEISDNNDNPKKEVRQMEKCSSCGAELVNGVCPHCSQAQRTADVKVITDSAVNAELKRTDEILALGEKYGMMGEARKFISEKRSVAEFQGHVLEARFNAQKIDAIDPNIGMNGQEVRQYSIVRAIRQMADIGRLDGLEREASDAVAKLCRRDAQGFYIPQDVLSKRSLNVTSATAGGYLVGTEVQADSMIELLRNRTLVASLGARRLGGLVGNIAIPKVTGGATAYWLPENGEVTGTDQSFGQIGLSPRRLVGDTAFSKELVMQSSLDVESFVREDLMRVLAIEKDRAAINGSGTSGEPLGIMNASSIKTVTFGAAPTWAKVVDFETQIADANADMGTMAYLTTPSTRGKWKTTVKVANTAVFLWGDGATPGSGLVNGYRAEATKQVPLNKVIFANWSDLIMADWAGMDVVVDPYSRKKEGLIEVTITIWTDNGIRHPESFCVSTDAGNQ